MLLRVLSCHSCITTDFIYFLQFHENHLNHHRRLRLRFLRRKIRPCDPPHSESLLPPSLSCLRVLQNDPHSELLEQLQNASQEKLSRAALWDRELVSSSETTKSP